MSQILADMSKEMAVSTWMATHSFIWHLFSKTIMSACYTEKPVTGQNSSKRKMFHCDFFVKITL